MDYNQNNASLRLAEVISERVNDAWASGEMLEQVTPTTAALLRFWFDEAQCDERERNFHAGQRQAIMNIIYLHEVVKPHSVLDLYEKMAPELAEVLNLQMLSQEKYQMAKYAVKMATGTGKTWVMHALMLWQMLNARHEQEPSGLFTQHFLVVAPGLIVYDRLKDAFCGRLQRGADTRNLQTNDFFMNQEVLVPPQFRPEVFSFIQNNVVTKEEGIGRKTTGSGLIALTNWHLFENQTKEDEELAAREQGMDPSDVVADLLPLRPGTSAGNDLNMLDRRYLRGTELDYLSSLSSLMVINDEAHHIHNIKRGGETDEVEWQRGLNKISSGVNQFVQVDFSATPFDAIGSGNKATKRYFPHIVVDFDLLHAMKQGLVKTLLLAKRKDLTDVTLDFRALRDADNKVCGLSSGQRLMLRAGLEKLKKLETEFLQLNSEKNPKMLVMCEDTNVSPFVVDFLLQEGLAEEDVLRIDSTEKGVVKEDEWQAVKTQLFDIDRFVHPKVIVSVLMLREGFDVNNICVIVPLRSSEAPILLEQTIGRGLRLMWREKEYEAMKLFNRHRILREHVAPDNYIDTLSIVEHPAFIRYYEDLLAGGLAGMDDEDQNGGVSAVGDMLKVGLKENFVPYDFLWPIILHESEEELPELDFDINTWETFSAYPLDRLRRFLASDGESFVLQDVVSKTQFGTYKVSADLFSARTYNEYLQKLLVTVTLRIDRLGRRERRLPNLQVSGAKLIGAVDCYIRTRLFGQPFNPFSGSDWKVLLSTEGIVTRHIIEQVSRAIYHQQNSVETTDAQVEHIPFSSIDTLRMRKSLSLKLVKTIYERLPFPSNSQLEKAFMEFLDRDGEVESFIKVNETQHAFAKICYLRDDGLLATYHPDFLVATDEKIYLVETKGNDRLSTTNVRRKWEATVAWTRRVNELKPEQRMGRIWEYVLLAEDNFYMLSANGANIKDICDRCMVSYSSATGELDFSD